MIIENIKDIQQLRESLLESSDAINEACLSLGTQFGDDNPYQETIDNIRDALRKIDTFQETLLKVLIDERD